MNPARLVPAVLTAMICLLTGSASAADAPAKRTRPLIGPTGALAMPLVAGKPVGLAIGLQTIVPVDSWRLAGELFVSTPVGGFTPALGGDLGLGLVNGHGVGLALAAYGRHTPAHDELPASTQLGPGLLLLSKIAPTVILTVPFVVWTDTATGSVTPTLTLKGVFGIPYGS